MNRSTALSLESRQQFKENAGELFNDF